MSNQSDPYVPWLFQQMPATSSCHCQPEEVPWSTPGGRAVQCSHCKRVYFKLEFLIVPCTECLYFEDAKELDRSDFFRCYYCPRMHSVLKGSPMPPFATDYNYDARSMVNTNLKLWHENPATSSSRALMSQQQSPFRSIFGHPETVMENVEDPYAPENWPWWSHDNEPVSQYVSFDTNLLESINDRDELMDDDEFDHEETYHEGTGQEEADQEEADQEETDQEEADQEETDQEEADQEETDQEEADQEEAASQEEADEDIVGEYVDGGNIFFHKDGTQTMWGLMLAGEDGYIAEYRNIKEQESLEGLDEEDVWGRIALATQQPTEGHGHEIDDPALTEGVFMLEVLQKGRRCLFWKCPKTTTYFMSEEALHDHIQYMHKYACGHDLCNGSTDFWRFNFSSREELGDHAKVLPHSAPFQLCPILKCFDDFNDIKALEDHYTEKHKLTCQFPSCRSPLKGYSTINFKYKRDLIQHHEDSHTESFSYKDRGPLICRVQGCKLAGTMIEDLIEHEEDMHPLQCLLENCCEPWQFGTMKHVHLYSHIDTHAIPEYSRTCPLCSKACRSVTEYLLHLKKYHSQSVCLSCDQIVELRWPRCGSCANKAIQRRLSIANSKDYLYKDPGTNWDLAQNFDYANNPRTFACPVFGCFKKQPTFFQRKDWYEHNMMTHAWHCNKPSCKGDDGGTWQYAWSNEADLLQHERDEHWSVAEAPVIFPCLMQDCLHHSETRLEQMIHQFGKHRETCHFPSCRGALKGISGMELQKGNQSLRNHQIRNHSAAFYQTTIICCRSLGCWGAGFPLASKEAKRAHYEREHPAVCVEAQCGFGLWEVAFNSRMALAVHRAHTHNDPHADPVKLCVSTPFRRKPYFQSCTQCLGRAIRYTEWPFPGLNARADVCLNCYNRCRLLEELNPTNRPVVASSATTKRQSRRKKPSDGQKSHQTSSSNSIASGSLVRRRRRPAQQQRL